MSTSHSTPGACSAAGTTRFVRLVPGLVAQLSGHFLEDLEVSTEIDLDTWRTRPTYQRIGEYATELISQSL